MVWTKQRFTISVLLPEASAEGRSCQPNAPRNRSHYLTCTAKLNWYLYCLCNSWNLYNFYNWRLCPDLHKWHHHRTEFFGFRDIYQLSHQGVASCLKMPILILLPVSISYVATLISCSVLIPLPLDDKRLIGCTEQNISVTMLKVVYIISPIYGISPRKS